MPNNDMAAEDGSSKNFKKTHTFLCTSNSYDSEDIWEPRKIFHSHLVFITLEISQAR